MNRVRLCKSALPLLCKFVNYQILTKQQLRKQSTELQLARDQHKQCQTYYQWPVSVFSNYCRMSRTEQKNGNGHRRRLHGGITPTTKKVGATPFFRPHRSLTAYSAPPAPSWIYRRKEWGWGETAGKRKEEMGKGVRGSKWEWQE